MPDILQEAKHSGTMAAVAIGIAVVLGTIGGAYRSHAIKSDAQTARAALTEAIVTNHTRTGTDIPVTLFGAGNAILRIDASSVSQKRTCVHADVYDTAEDKTGARSVTGPDPSGWYKNGYGACAAPG